MKELDFGVKWFNTVFYPNRKTGRATRYEDGVLPRLRLENITLFTPWGPRYKWKERGCSITINDKEAKLLEFFAETFRTWQKNMPDKKFRWIFLGADLYGTRVNNLPVEAVSQYFCSVAENISLTLPSEICEFRLWSEFDAEATLYRGMVQSNLENLVSLPIRIRAAETAKKMGGGNPSTYLIERIAEAYLIEEKYKPIKVSAVGRHKDAGVDGNLPALYVVPAELHAPWF